MSYFLQLACLVDRTNGRITSMRNSACIIKIGLYPSTIRRLDYHRRNRSGIKHRILRFIFDLIDSGYRHFIVYIDDQADYWIAEMLYFISLNEHSRPITYSLYLRSESSGHPICWIEDEFIFRDVMNHASKIRFQIDNLYDYPYHVEELICSQEPYIASQTCGASLSLLGIDEYGRKTRSAEPSVAL